MNQKQAKQPCWCGKGSDNTLINENGSAYCFRCSSYTPSYAKAIEGVVEVIPKTHHEPVNNVTELAEFRPIPDRKLTEETCRAYGVTVTESNSGIATHNYPYYNTDNHQVSTKTRYCATKNFTIVGSHNEAGLFGRQNFKAGGKYITVCEGELDAMSVYQMTGSKWPAVSVKNGASGAVKDFKAEIEYLEAFDNIVLCFDNDTPGREAAEKVARLIRPGKCKIMTLPEGFKDASDMLVANRSADFSQCFWNAEVYTPAGILNISQMEEEFFKPEEQVVSVPYPWEGLNVMLEGLRKKELVTLTGGTGLGKSSVTRELEHYLLTTTDHKVGILALEEDWKRTAMGIVSIEVGARLTLDRVRKEFPEEKIRMSYNKLFKENNANRLYVHAHLGVQDIDEIFNKLRYLIIGCDCDWIIVDHLHMLLPSNDNGDERKTIDEIMLRLRSLVEETGCGMILVSHLRRTANDRGHEQGVEVSLSHLRGSGSIGHISDTVIALERNQQANDLNWANTTTLRVLKSRHTGDAGVACYLRYDKDTGRLTEVDPDESEFSNMEGGNYDTDF